MASQQKLTEYERKRLENIKRNDEMLAALKIQSKLTQLSAVSTAKRPRPQSKSYKVSPDKKQKAEPIVLRRSLRTRGQPPDSEGLKDDFDETLKVKKTPKLQILPKKVFRENGPLSMKDAYIGDVSDQKLIERILDVSKKAKLNCIDSSNEEIDGHRVKEEDSVNRVKEEFVWHGVTREIDGHCIKEEIGGHSLKEEIGGHSLKEETDGELPLVGKIKTKVWGSINEESLKLEPQNIARVVPGRILNVKFFPTADVNIVVVGNKFGNVGLWRVNAEDDEHGIYVYHPHSGPVSGILIHPFSMSKMFTSCYDGFIRLMEVEREVFDLVHFDGDSIFSLSQRPNDMKSLYFGKGTGQLDIWDERAGKSSVSWNLHEARINSIDFNPVNTSIMATSSTDGTACIWDVRYVDADKPKSLKTVSHKRAVYSAYFSPSGKCLATTSHDDTVGLLTGDNFEDLSMVTHYNQTSRWISTFRAIWGWDDSSIFIGNMRRGVDVISAAKRRLIATLQSEHMSAIPCRFDVHPCTVGMLAGATSGGQVYIWTS